MNTGKHTTAAAHRRIRSYVRREGRLTPGQSKALEQLWSRYGLEHTQTWDMPAIFPRPAAVTLEIGFGNGASLAQMAAATPGENFIGIEVHRPGVGHLLQELQRRQLDNVRVCNQDAVEILEHSIADATLSRVLLLFPDPWPKKKHHKRRLVQPDFVALVARKLAPGGIFHLATDWQPYAEHMLQVLESSNLLTNTAGSGHYAIHANRRPATKFERRGERLGQPSSDLVFIKSF